MRIISFIEDEQLVKKILKHLDLWDVRRKPPARAHGPPPETFIIYDELSSPGADDYIIDADYPIDLSRCSSKNEDGNLPLEKSSPIHSGELCPNSVNCPIASQKIKVDNKARFRYQVGYWFRLIDASICGASAEADTQFTIFL
jgi:hypothetical protein